MTLSVELSLLVFLEDYKSMKPDSCIYETIYSIDVFRDPRVETWHEESSDVFEYTRLNPVDKMCSHT